MSEDDRVSIELKKPIKLGAETYTALSFRPLKGKDLRRLKVVEGYSTDVILTLAGKLAGVPTQVIDELTGEDLGNVLTLVGGFMPGSPSTGEIASEP